MSEQQRWWQKTNVANMVAGVVIVGALAWAMYTGNAEMLKVLAYAGIGYLFGKASK